MYSIGNVIYGIPVDENLYEKIKAELGEEWEEEFMARDEKEFLSWYSGSGDMTPMAIGVEIDTIDVCEHINLTELMKNLKIPKGFKVPEKLKKFVKEIKPDFWIVWSTS